VHKVPSLKNSLNPHRDLIQYIKKHKLTGSPNNRVTVVFDGHIDNDAIREREFEVIFGLGKSADSVIKERVHKLKNKSEVLVVSDDREIADYVRKEGAKPVKIADFIKIKEPKPRDEGSKEISYTLQAQITEELRKIWLKE
jgi:predicted RNA-binding protein with PIN domain